MEEGEFFNAIKKFEKSTLPRRGNGKKSTSIPKGINVKKEFTHAVSNFSEVADFKKRLAALVPNGSVRSDITYEEPMSSFEFCLGST